MNKTTALKRLAAILLLVSFFLPLSRCTAVTGIQDGKVVETRTVVTYAYSRYEWPSTNACLTYASFLWPSVLAILGLVWPALARNAAIWALELLICAGSAYMLWGLVLFGEVLYGGYIAAAAILAYFVVTSAQLVGRLWRRFIPRARLGGSAP